MLHHWIGSLIWITHTGFTCGSFLSSLPRRKHYQSDDASRLIIFNGAAKLHSSQITVANKCFGLVEVARLLKLPLSFSFKSACLDFVPKRLLWPFLSGSHFLSVRKHIRWVTSSQTFQTKTQHNYVLHSVYCVQLLSSFGAKKRKLPELKPNSSFHVDARRVTWLCMFGGFQACFKKKKNKKAEGSDTCEKRLYLLTLLHGKAQFNYQC